MYVMLGAREDIAYTVPRENYQSWEQGYIADF
jgi:hypothetical protein